MKTWKLEFTVMDDGAVSIASENCGVGTSDMIALLEMKKMDIMAQISPETNFKRVFVDSDGNKKEIVEE